MLSEFTFTRSAHPVLDPTEVGCDLAHFDSKTGYVLSKIGQLTPDALNVRSHFGSELGHFTPEALDVRPHFCPDAMNIRPEVCPDAMNFRSEVRPDSINFRSEVRPDTTNFRSEVVDVPANGGMGLAGIAP
ncbi:MAG: hypothetical protein F4Z21_01025 [Acidobacteria bacterium]|nr:hypothetical protein [Acidobacteriota bacterium]